MRIGLNLLHVQPSIGGVWNYILRLISTLGGEGDSNTYICFVTRSSIDVVPTGKKNIEIVLVDIDPISRWRRVLYENTMLPFQVKRYRIDVLHWFAATQSFYSGTRNVVSVYDLQVFENPLLFPPLKRLYLRYMMAYTARKADLLLPMSGATAQQLKSFFSVPEHRIVTIRTVISEQFRRTSYEEIDLFRSRYGLPEHFWLYVAHFYPHKNHKRLVEAYNMLKRTGSDPWPLVLRGDAHSLGDDIARLVQQLGLAQDIIFLPKLTESELPALYSAASAVVFPSLYEGGAIPVVEAMSCGCPVITSRLSLFLEYQNGISDYFDPQSVDEIAGAIHAFQLRHQDFSSRHDTKWTVEEHSPSCVARKLQDAYISAYSESMNKPRA